MPHTKKMRKRVVVSLVLLSTVIVTGTLGYTLIEGWDLFDSFYMTIVTLTTIGYEEVHKLSRAGRVFNIFMIPTPSIILTDFKSLVASEIRSPVLCLL